MDFLRKYAAHLVIGFLFLIRLYGITQPPLEVNHHWRQVTGLMVARNYYEGNTDFLHPMIDDIGVGESASSGVIGMEFPALNYAMAAVSCIFGYDHWYGRLLVLMLSSVGLYYFYLLIRRYAGGEKVALISVAVLGVSVWFAFSRKTMPDTVCISLAIAALYHVLRYRDEGRLQHLFFYLVLASLAVLIKIAAVCILSVVPLVALSTWSLKWQRSVSAIVFSAIPLVLMVWWYFSWNPHLAAESGIWYNLGESASDAMRVFSAHSGEVAKNFYFSTLMSYVALPFLAIGLFVLIRNPQTGLKYAAAIVFMVFLFYAFRSGRHFALQHYYMIPLAPLMSFVVALGIARIPWRFAALTITLAISAESIANQQHDFRIHDRNLYKLKLEGILDRYIPRDAYIVINGEGNPQELYFSHRKGWVCTSDQLSNPVYLSRVRNSGAAFVVVNRHRTDTEVEGKELYRDDDYKIIEFN